MKNETEIEAIRVVFSGRVQGVGFRYTAARLAEENQISGWVRNASDGSVELVAFGSVENVDHFLKTLQNRMEGNIEQIRKQPTTLASKPTRFEIRH